jgi:crossover junction endodeoxyribonuclease RuvC
MIICIFDSMNTPGTDSDKIILGIDPGTNVMGYGLIAIDGRELSLLGAGIIRLEKESDHGMKLSKIFKECQKLIERYHPDEMAIEAPFYGKNVQSMLKLGRAQGVSIAAAIAYEIPVFEYSPKSIKQAITGNGNASKEQVAAMLKDQLNFEETPKYLDATDGLAAAVCHYYKESSGLNSGKSGNKGWDDFIRKNPGRVS